MEAYTVYEVVRRVTSENPTFVGYQFEDEEIVNQVEVDADHSDCERFYCRFCCATYSYAALDSLCADSIAMPTRDWGLECAYDGVHTHGQCPDCQAMLCDGPHRAEHRTDYADVIRVKVPDCGAQFELTLNSAAEVVEFKEVERNWFKAYDYENLSETPIINRDGRWLKMLADYYARPDFVRMPEMVNPPKLEELEQEDDVIAARSFVLSRGEENLWVARDEDGFYFAIEV